MNEQLIKELLAIWLNIKIDEVDNFYLMHRCKPLKLSTLIELFKSKI